MDKPYKKLIQWLIVIACFLYLFFFFKSNWPDLKNTLELTRVFHPLTLLLILVMQLIYYVMNAYSMRIVTQKYSNKRIAFPVWFKIFMVGRFLNKLAAQSGNVYRSFRLKKEFGISYTEYISVFVSFFWFDMIFNFACALLVVSLAGGLGDATDQRVVYLLVFLLACIIAAPLLVNQILKTTSFKSEKLLWVRTKLSEGFAYARRSLHDYAFVLKMVSMNAVVFVHNGLLFYICFKSMGVSVTPADIAVFYAVYKVGIYVNVTPGNLGVQEIYLGFASEFLGIGMGQGVLVSLIIRSLGFVTQIVLGLLFGGSELLYLKKKAGADITSPR